MDIKLLRGENCFPRMAKTFSSRPSFTRYCWAINRKKDSIFRSGFYSFGEIQKIIQFSEFSCHHQQMAQAEARKTSESFPFIEFSSREMIFINSISHREKIELRAESRPTPESFRAILHPSDQLATVTYFQTSWCWSVRLVFTKFSLNFHSI